MQTQANESGKSKPLESWDKCVDLSGAEFGLFYLGNVFVIDVGHVDSLGAGRDIGGIRFGGDLFQNASVEL